MSDSNLSLPTESEMTDRPTGRSSDGVVVSIFDMLAKFQAIPKVYSGYLGMGVKRALKAADTESIIADIGEMQTIGDCKYAIPVTDFNGTRYRVTVEVLL
jgi:hypothetical protein